jgi:hypothetical protein
MKLTKEQTQDLIQAILDSKSLAVRRLAYFEAEVKRANATSINYYEGCRDTNEKYIESLEFMKRVLEKELEVFDG